MEKLLLLMVMFGMCCAATQDLSGKVFVFPKETNTDYVKLVTTKTVLNFVTTCLRFQTDLSRNYGLFSMATTTHNNEFVLFKTDTGDIRVYARDGESDFMSLSFPRNTWHSLCATWRSDTGVAQLWLNGKATIQRFTQTGAITGTPISILGQEQDTYGGGFDATESFVGMITDVHMWDRVIPSTDIKRYMAGKCITPGNVLNWQQLNYQIVGQILVQEESEVR